MKETAELARYAATCRYEDIPPDVVERAKQCITDTVAAVVFGYDLPWSRMIVAFAEKNGAGGNSRILGGGAGRVHAPAAALANGALAHAFEPGRTQVCIPAPPCWLPDLPSLRNAEAAAAT